LDIRNDASKWLAVLLLTQGLAGCATGIGLPWIPQGPGISPEEARANREAKARGEAAPQPAVRAPAAEQPSARRFEVSPDLYAQSAPPPRSAAAIAADTASAQAGGYTQATRYGDLLFVAGQIALDANNQMRGASAGEQTRFVMEQIRAILESHRLTMANVVSVTVYLKDLNDFRAMDGAYESFFRGALPARSIVEVSRLPRGALVEISVVAGR